MRLSDFMIKEFKIGTCRIRPIDLLLLCCTVLFALLLRSTVWMIEGPAETELSLLGNMALPMKAAGIAVDFVLAGLCGLYVGMLSKSRTKSLLVFSVTAFLPPLVMSSSMWGTADSIYLCFVILTLLLWQKQNRTAACIVFFLAASFGESPLFLLAPLLAFALPGTVFADAKKASPASFAGMLVAGVSGGVIRSALMAYRPGLFFMTAAEDLVYRARGTELLSYNYPNLYQMIGPDAFVSEYGMLYPAIAVVTGIGLFVYALRERKRAEAGDQLVLLRVSLASSLILPFVLPGMNERAGLLAVIISLCLAFCQARFIGYFIATTILSFMAQAAYFRGESFLPLSYAALAALLLILLLCCKGRKESYEKG